jgi:N-dimethylarginine dimethylaminohydrolase
MTPKVYRDLIDVDFTLNDIPERDEPGNVLLCTPEFFDIVDEKNIHMASHAGTTDKGKARDQWNRLKEVYDELAKRGIIKEVSIIDGAAGCEDMVFCANQTFPWKTKTNENLVVLSNMRHSSRQREVSYFEKFFQQKGFVPRTLKNGEKFEGMGDVIPHPQKMLLYGGYGHRTNLEAYEEIAELLGAPVIALELIDPRFYHLDTCFVPLSENSVMLCSEAFTPGGMELIKQSFPVIYEVPAEEASKFFSLNAHAFELASHKVAIMQKGSTITKNILAGVGFEIIELETSEFMKSGGSVFCMKMMY